MLVVYAVDDRQSFDDVTNWMIQLEQNGHENIIKMLVANKCDLVCERTVSAEEGRMLADQFKCGFMEVSAKEDINVEPLFKQLSRSILNVLRAQMEEETVPDEAKPIPILNPSKEKQECCA